MPTSLATPFVSAVVAVPDGAPLVTTVESPDDCAPLSVSVEGSPRMSALGCSPAMMVSLPTDSGRSQLVTGRSVPDPWQAASESEATAMTGRGESRKAGFARTMSFPHPTDVNLNFRGGYWTELSGCQSCLSRRFGRLRTGNATGSRRAGRGRCWRCYLCRFGQFPVQNTLINSLSGPHYNPMSARQPCRCVPPPPRSPGRRHVRSAASCSAACDQAGGRRPATGCPAARRGWQTCDEGHAGARLRSRPPCAPKAKAEDRARTAARGSTARGRRKGTRIAAAAPEWRGPC